MHIMFRLVAIASFILCCHGIRMAEAQDYPSRPLTLVVPFPAGGAVDVVGRLVGQKLSVGLGKPVTIDNRAGFAGNIGAQYVAKAPADGYTLLMAALTTYSINATLMRGSAGYDLEKDFAPIGIVGVLPLVLVINASLPANSLAELIALARKRPGELTYASAGNGSVEHVTGELFKRQAGVDILHIPYKGAAPAVTDLLGGQVFIMFATVPTALANLKGTRLKAIAVTTPQRLTTLPNVPTMNEAGLKGFEVSSVYGVLAAADTPKPVIDRLNRELAKAVKFSDVKERFQLLGIQPTHTSPEQAAARIRNEIARWGKVVTEASIKVE